MTAEKNNLTKKKPSSLKKKYFFHFTNSTCVQGLARDLPLREIKRNMKYENGQTHVSTLKLLEKVEYSISFMIASR
jgi:hypothetical protein